MKFKTMFPNGNIGKKRVNGAELHQAMRMFLIGTDM